MMKPQWIGIVLTVTLMQVHLPASETLRVGIDVPEPKLIKRVEIVYPDAAKNQIDGNGTVVLNILIDEQGAVFDVTEQSFESEFLEAAKSAVKQWRFSPTIVNGKAVSVTATLVAVFSAGGTPSAVDLGTQGETLKLPRGNIRSYCFAPAVMDRDGNLKKGVPPDIVIMDFDLQGNRTEDHPCSNQPYKDYLLIPESDVPFSKIEKKMKEPTPLSLFRLRAPRYRFLDLKSPPIVKHARPGSERLYYSVLVVSDGSQLVQLVGIDPNVQPPRFDIDFARLAELPNVRRFKNGAVFFYTIFVDENGCILGIEANNDENPAVVDALNKSRAITPGLRNGIPVPTAVILAIRTP